MGSGNWIGEYSWHATHALKPWLEPISKVLFLFCILNSLNSSINLLPHLQCHWTLLILEQQNRPAHKMTKNSLHCPQLSRKLRHQFVESRRIPRLREGKCLSLTWVTPSLPSVCFFYSLLLPLKEKSIIRIINQSAHKHSVRVSQKVGWEKIVLQLSFLLNFLQYAAHQLLIPCPFLDFSKANYPPNN